MPPSNSPPLLPLYLLYGNQHESVLKARDEIVDRLIAPESRNENLTNYFPSGASQKIALMSIFDEIAGDLATMSFFPGAAKVIVVTNPEEVFAAEGDGETSRSKRGAGNQAALLHWLEHDLPETGNHLLLLALEDETAGRAVNDRQPNAFLKLIQKIGWVRGYRDKQAMFKIEDALLQRDLNTLLEAIRALWSTKTDQMILNKIASVLRDCMQANIARERKLKGSVAMASPLFPQQPQNSLFKSHAFVQKKHEIAFFRTGDLIKGHLQLLNVYRAMRPRPGDVYVPDALGLLEQTLLELIRSPRPRR